MKPWNRKKLIALLKRHGWNRSSVARAAGVTRQRVGQLSQEFLTPDELEISRQAGVKASIDNRRAPSAREEVDRASEETLFWVETLPAGEFQAAMGWSHNRAKAFREECRRRGIKTGEYGHWVSRIRWRAIASLVGHHGWTIRDAARSVGLRGEYSHGHLENAAVRFGW